jgi:phage virion morphogenesis protein
MEGDGLEALASYLVDLTDRLKPGERAKLGRRIATELQKANAARIAANVDPEGAAFVPRKKHRQLRGRAKSGLRARRKQGKMFLRARSTANLRAKANASEARVGFVGAMVRIMGVHQEGLEDHVTRDPSSPIAKYPMRRVLGFGPDDRLMILELLDAQLRG